MNRRHFLQTIGPAIAGLFFAPAIASTPQFNLADMKHAVQSMKANAMCGEDYYAAIHPDSLAMFVSIHRRGQWKDAYREWRRAARPGAADPQSIWSRYARTFDDVKFYQQFELGRFESVRFIQSRALP